ncbi:hypothetical protein [Xenorhabdus siamensis]
MAAWMLPLWPGLRKWWQKSGEALSVLELHKLMKKTEEIAEQILRWSYW